MRGGVEEGAPCAREAFVEGAQRLRRVREGAERGGACGGRGAGEGDEACFLEGGEAEGGEGEVVVVVVVVVVVAVEVVVVAALGARRRSTTRA